MEYVFRWVLKAAAEEGYLDTEAIFVDGTHIKASANLKKQAKKAVPKQAKRYAKELFAEVNRDREEHGKKPFSDDSDKNPPQEKQTKETVVSTTDPESGVFHKGEHKKCFAYEAHTACDKHNFVLGVYVTLCMMKCAETTPSTKPWWRTAPTKRLGSAKGSSGAAAFFPLAIPVPRPKRTAIPGGCMCMTSTLMM